MIIHGVAECRLYFNHGRNTSDKPWSVDFGKGTCEILARTVMVNDHGLTVYDPNGGFVKACVRFRNVKLELSGDVVAITHDQEMDAIIEG